MKRLLLFVLLLVFLQGSSSVASAASFGVQTTTFVWNDLRGVSTTTTATSLQLWVCSSDEWVDSTGVLHGASSVGRRTFTFRVTGLTYVAATQLLTIPAFTIPSTRDAVRGSNVTLTFRIVRVSGTAIEDIAAVPGTANVPITVPATFSTSTGCSPGPCGSFAELIAYNSPPAPIPPATYPTFDDVSRLINANISSGVQSSRLLTATSPLLIDGTTSGDLSANRTFSLAGLTGLGSANRIVGMNNAATTYEYKTLATGTSGTDFAIAHTANTVTFNIPSSSASNRGLLLAADWTTFNSKQVGLGLTGVSGSGTTAIGATITSATVNDTLVWDGSKWVNTALATVGHEVLSTTHSDTTAATVVRGDVITGQGATPKWARLAKGTQYQALQAGANEPLYDAVHLDQAAAVTGALPIANGGTNSTTSLNNNRLMESSGGAIVEKALGAANSVVRVNNGGTANQYVPVLGGANITITHNANDITIAASGSTGYGTVENNAVAVTQRATLNIISNGLSAVDNGGKTELRLPDAGAATTGVLTSGTQTIGGAKTGSALWTFTTGADGKFRDKGGAVYNVTHATYGADPTGVSDASTAIQAAITDATAAGGVVYIPEGTYIINAQLTLPGNVTLRGAGKLSVLKQKNATNLQSVIKATGTTFNVIESLAIDGNKANQTTNGKAIILTTAANDNKIRNVHVFGTYECGIQIFKSHRNQIIGCSFATTGNSTAMTDSAIVINSDVAASNQSVGNIIAHCTFNATTAGGINFDEGSDHSRVEDNYFISTGNNSIQLEDRCRYNAIVGNSIELAAGDGIDILTSSEYNTVTGNTIRACTADGIAMVQASHNTISANNVSACQARGIYLSPSGDSNNNVIANNSVVNNNQTTANNASGIEVAFGDDNLIIGNEVIDNQGSPTQRYGIEILASQVRNTIIGNKVRGNVLGQIQDAGTTTQLSQNDTGNSLGELLSLQQTLPNNTTINGLNTAGNASLKMIGVDTVNALTLRSSTAIRFGNDTMSTEYARFASTGGFSIGGTAAPTLFNIIDGNITARRGNPSGAGTSINWETSRGTVGSPTISANLDITGLFNSFGHDGTNYIRNTSFFFGVDGTPAAGIVPGSIHFETWSTAGAEQEVVKFSAQAKALFNRLQVTGAGVGISVSSTEGRPLEIESTTNSLGAPVSSVLLKGAVNKERMEIRSVGGGANIAVYGGSNASGTLGTPGASVANLTLVRLAGQGHDGTNFIAGAKGYFDVVAGSTFSGTNNETYLTFGTTPASSTTVAERARISSAGQLKIGGTAARSTTDGAGGVDLFNGTAPAGTLTNGVSLTSQSGRFIVSDASGNLSGIRATGRSTAQTAAVASVATYTVGSADGSFEVSANVLVTTATNHSFTVTCAYTDEGNTARTLTLTFGLVAGGVAVTSVANANGAVPYHGVPVHIRCKAATAITIATTGTFTTVTYNVEGIIRELT